MRPIFLFLLNIHLSGVDRPDSLTCHRTRTWDSEPDSSPKSERAQERAARFYSSSCISRLLAQTWRTFSREPMRTLTDNGRVYSQWEKREVSWGEAWVEVKGLTDFYWYEAMNWFCLRPKMKQTLLWDVLRRAAHLWPLWRTLKV